MPQGNQLRVLLVEDSALVADQISEQLSAVVGVEHILPVSTQLSAVRAIDEFKPNVAIVDLLLREGNGFGVLRALRAANPRPATIVLTNFALPRYREYAQLIGVDYFLDKLKDFELLYGIVETIGRARAE